MGELANFMLESWCRAQGYTIQEARDASKEERAVLRERFQDFLATLKSFYPEHKDPSHE